MKKVFVFSILILTFSGSCFAQNNEQRIIGTWVSENGRATWVFNANGTLTIGTNEYKFGVTDSLLALYRNEETEIWGFSISSDGRTLIVERHYGQYSYGYWLIKR